VNVHEELEALRTTVTEARSMPMSASCILNRAELLERIAELGEALPRQLTDAETVLAEREAVLAAARDEAARIEAEAVAERERLLAVTAAGREAAAWAEEVRTRAAEDAARTRAEIDEYVDAKLANFEVVLEKSLATARRGRERVAENPAVIDEEMRTEVVAFVDTTLVDFIEVLDKALLSVRRGRDRLRGRHDMEELGEHMRAQDDEPLSVADLDLPGAE
jgi:hypothetical protein